MRGFVPFVRTTPAPSEPIFIVAPPRSGSTIVFDLLNRSSAVTSLDRESHLMWEGVRKPTPVLGGSHALSAGDVRSVDRRALHWAVGAICGPSRYLDKFPRHSLRVPYLRAIFPDAHFVFVRRDGRATVSSLITGWRSGRFGSPTLPQPPLAIRGFEGTLWQFARPPGWQSYTSGVSLEEVCAFQWVSTNEAALDASRSIPPEQWHDVAYEDLVRRPVEVARELLDRLGLPLEEPVLDFAASLSTHVSRVTVTRPEDSKWRHENPDEVERVLPMIAPTMIKLGYPDPRHHSASS